MRDVSIGTIHWECGSIPSWCPKPSKASGDSDGVNPSRASLCPTCPEKTPPTGTDVFGLARPGTVNSAWIERPAVEIMFSAASELLQGTNVTFSKSPGYLVGTTRNGFATTNLLTGPAAPSAGPRKPFGMAAFAIPRHGSRPSRIPTNHSPAQRLPRAISLGTKTMRHRPSDPVCNESCDRSHVSRWRRPKGSSTYFPHRCLRVSGRGSWRLIATTSILRLAILCTASLNDGFGQGTIGFGFEDFALGRTPPYARAGLPSTPPAVADNFYGRVG